MKFNMGKDYNDALERCKEVFNMNNLVYSPSEIEAKLKYVFPQLETNEDERIKQKIIKLIKKSNEVGGYALHKWEADEMLVWLEKQGEQKLINNIEPKFKVGDWIIDDKNRVGIIVRILDEHYIISFDGREVQISFEWEGKLFRKWSIKDVKDGDVIAEDPIDTHPSSFVAIYKKQNEEDFDTFDSYCFVGFDGKFYENEYGHCSEDIHPATKEQCDLLFQKMKEAGYEWDAEKNELKKIMELNQ